MNVQLPPNDAIRSERRSPKVRSWSNSFPIFSERISCCLQAVDHFLVERGQFPDLVLQNLFDVIAAECAEVVDADETVRIEGGHFFLDEIEQRRPDQIAEGTRTGRECFMTDLALRFGDLCHDQE